MEPRLECVPTDPKGRDRRFEPMSRNTSVLVVDDDDGLRESLLEAFDREGYRTYQADCGSVALDILERHPVDCSVLDVHLPDATGFTVYSQAVRHQPGLRAIFASAAGTPDLRGAALEAGAFFFLDKPFLLPLMLNLVARAVRGESRPEFPQTSFPSDLLHPDERRPEGE